MKVFKNCLAILFAFCIVLAQLTIPTVNTVVSAENIPTQMVEQDDLYSEQGITLLETVDNNGTQSVCIPNITADEFASDIRLDAAEDEQITPTQCEENEQSVTIPETVLESHRDTVSIASESYDFATEIVSVGISTASASARVAMKISNKTDKDKTVYVHTAAYDPLGSLCGYNVTDFSTKKGTRDTLFVELGLSTNKSGNTLTVFLWDENMQPLAAPVSRSFNFTDTAYSVTFANESPVININLNRTLQLSYTVSPSSYKGGVTFKSSNPSIATVSSSGLVTAIKSGTTVIQATTADGCAYGYCFVIVYQENGSLVFNTNMVNMWSTGSYKLTATPSPDPNALVTFVSSDPDVATVDKNGLVVAKRSGYTTISAFCQSAMSVCEINVYNEADFIATIAAQYESNNNPGLISSGSGDVGGKSYGCFQLSTQSNGPKSFYNWLISTGFNTEIGNALKEAHAADGGKDYSFGTNFDALWKQIAAEAPEEFRSCQLTYTKTQYYDVLYNRLRKSVANGGLDFNPDNYGIALKSGLLSRAVQHGATGAFNRIKAAFETIGGYKGKTERELIAAIYAECGAVVTTPPSSSSIAMNSGSSIAVEYGLVGKYMKYYSSNSSSIQASVWRRLNVNEPKDLYALLDSPPVIITPQY